MFYRYFGPPPTDQRSVIVSAAVVLVYITPRSSQKLARRRGIAVACGIKKRQEPWCAACHLMLASRPSSPTASGGSVSQTVLSEKAGLLRAAFDAAVTAAHPDHCLPLYLPRPPRGRLIVVGAGKAAAAMAVATERHYASLSADRLSGFVVTRTGFSLPTNRIEILEASHPVPDANGERAASRALAAVQEAGSDDIVLCLLSGGASALWPLPVAGIDLAAKQRLTRQLLRSGAPISEINCVRKHLSGIKGGKLAAAAYPAVILTLAISDVPGDDPSSIGSGPTVGDPTTLAQARAILAKYAIVPETAVAAALLLDANETPKPDDTRLATSVYRIVARPAASLEAAGKVLTSAGYEIRLLGDALEGEARDVGRAHARLALEARQRGERVAILSGGEFTVTVRGNGRGGPNQEYAMGLAMALDGAPGIHALAADTDGIDGGSGEATDPAGALIDPETLGRARTAGLDCDALLANNDSTGFFDAVGGLLRVGPTQTNVNDLRIILVDP
jgi:hydroxypyruvate reductase